MPCRISAPPPFDEKIFFKRPLRISAHPSFVKRALIRILYYIYLVFETFLVKEHYHYNGRAWVSPCSNYLFFFIRIGFKNQKSNCCGCKEISAPSNKRGEGGALVLLYLTLNVLRVLLCPLYSTCFYVIRVMSLTRLLRVSIIGHTYT